MKKPTRTDCIKNDVCKYPDDGMCPMECGYYQTREIMSSCDGCKHSDSINGDVELVIDKTLKGFIIYMWNKFLGRIKVNPNLCKRCNYLSKNYCTIADYGCARQADDYYENL